VGRPRHLIRLWRRHRCPPDVEITITVDGRPVIGPMTGEQMAYVAMYGGFDRDSPDLLEIDRDATWTYGRLQLLARYIYR
jgi:hypothetical protein